MRRHQLFDLISRARRELQQAEEMAKAVVVHDMPEDDIASDMLEVRARVAALEDRCAAIEERSKE